MVSDDVIHFEENLKRDDGEFLNKTIRDGIWSSNLGGTFFKVCTSKI